jgi:hypothetical protein
MLATAGSFVAIYFKMKMISDLSEDKPNATSDVAPRIGPFDPTPPTTISTTAINSGIQLGTLFENRNQFQSVRYFQSPRTMTWDDAKAVRAELFCFR